MSDLIATTRPGETVRITTNTYTEPFWKAAAERRLVAPRCGACGRFRMPPTPFCPNCQSNDLDWVTLSGRAVVYSYAVVHGFPGIPDIVIVPVVVNLPDAPGARLVTNVIDIDPDDVSIGMELEVDFVPIAEGRMLPVFRAAAHAPTGSRSRSR